LFFISEFKLYQYKLFGNFYYWCITNKAVETDRLTSDDVYSNKTAVKGQIKNARLICETKGGKTTCRWEFDIQ